MYKKNLLRNIITLVALSCLSLNVFANEIQLKKNHPHRHVVTKGDTLWGISGKFLSNPWLWPKVWRMNRSQIKNPHLIYPGDVVVLDTSGKYPQLRLLHETVTLEPTAIVEPLEKEAIKTISPSAIAPFLSQPLLIENGQLESSPRIIAGPDDRVILSPGSRVYINKIFKRTGKDTGRNWNIYRAGQQFIDPDTKEVLGVEAEHLGDLTITKFGEPASADIVSAKEEILVKDRLVAAPDTFQSNFVPHAPENQVRGRIIRVNGGVAGGVAEAGPGTVVTINLGKNDGLEPGHVLAISRYGRVIQDPEHSKESTKYSSSKLKPGQVKLPDERVGLMMVFRTFNRVSYALITNSSNAVYTLDAVHTP